MKLIHAFFAALLAAALTLPLSACSAVLLDAYTVNEDAADAPEAVSGTEYTVRFPVSPYGEAVSETTASDDGDINDTASDCAAYIKSNVDSLFVRSGPGTEYPVLGTLDNGDMTAYSGKENGWYVTVCKEQTAYVSANAEYTSVYLIPKGSPEVESVIAAAESLLGYPYIYGSQRYHCGNGTLNPDFVTGEFDCSALTRYAYYKGAGIALGLTTRDQVKQGTRVDGEFQRGDLMFFTNASRYELTGTERVGHVAIYLGENYILHTASDHAVIEPLSEKRLSYFIEARRIIPGV